MHTPRQHWRFLTVMLVGWIGPLGDSSAVSEWATDGAPSAEEPLHQIIDRMIEADLGDRIAARSTDSEFLRRISIDLTGMPPSSREARSFLDDPSPYKRLRLIDQLLESPEYARRMQIFFDVMWMQRRRDQHVDDDLWDEYLYQAIRQNRPYDALVREILQSDGTNLGDRGPSKFVLERGAEPDLLTRDVARLFLGRDMQCAQCHDHPLVGDYAQADYFGIYAFVKQLSLFTDKKTNRSMLAEKAGEEVQFTSVFKKEITRTTGPRILDQPVIDEPTFDGEDEAYLVKPAKNVRTVPRFSRYAQLGPALTRPEVRDFSRNIVNRLWSLVMKRGLIEPVDLISLENPSSHPELLDVLADWFVNHDHDINAFLRELVRSETYQRSSEPAPWMSTEDCEPYLFSVGQLQPLGPEALAWSVMRVTGLVDRTRSSFLGVTSKNDPKLAAILGAGVDPTPLSDQLLEEFTNARLTGGVNQFVQRFGGVPGQPENVDDPSVQQALYLANGRTIQGWLNPSGNNLTARLVRAESIEALAEELYLSTYTRRPTADEVALVAEYLSGRNEAERTEAIKELIWSILVSTEFRFNH